MGLRARKVRQTRNALVDKALEMFTDRGFDGVTLDDLCDAVQVSRRTFFRRFRNKEDVVLAPMDDLWAEFLERLAQAPLNEPSLVGFLGGVLGDAITLMPEGWEARMLASTRLTNATASIGVESLAVCERTRTASTGILEQRFDMGDADPVEVSLSVRMLVAGYQTAVELWLDGSERSGAPDLAETTRSVMSALPRSVTTALSPRGPRQE